MIFCPACQEPVPDGVLACPNCRTPIDHSKIVVGNLRAGRGAEFVAGGINWAAIVVGAAIALGLWNGGMQLLAWAFGLEAIWFGVMVKVTAVFAGSFYAGYRSYSAELTHGLLVAALIGLVNGALFVFVFGIEITMTLVLMDLIFIDLGAALAGAFLGARAQH